MKAEVFTIAIYVSGFVGLFGIGLLPIRCWSLIKKLSARKRLLVAASLVASAFGAIDVIAAHQVFTCLTQPRCGPGIASGWLYLSMFGVAYIVFELVGYGLGSLAKATALRAQA